MESIQSISKERMQHMLSIFRTLEIVSQNDHDFNPNQHYNKTDPDYSRVIKYYDDFTGLFNYKAFVKNSIESLGTDFQRVLIGYEHLIEKYCDPAANYLQPKTNQMTLRGQELETCNDYEEFRSVIFQIIAKHKAERIFCIDKNHCFITPTNLMINSSADLYPVRIIKVELSVDYLVSYKSKANN